MKILITGIAGTGKSTIISELKKLGEEAIDLDTANVCAWVNKQTGKEAVYKEGSGSNWIKEHRWQVITSELINLLSTLNNERTIYIGGKVAKIQLREMADIFDKIFLLKPRDAVIDSRLESRTSNINNFAKEKEERDEVISNRHKFEKACLDVGAIPLDNSGTVQEIIEYLRQYKIKL